MDYRETSSGILVPNTPLHVGPDEHVSITGRNGTGKTWMARKIHAGDKYVVVHDTKGDFKWPEVSKNDVTLVTRLDDLPRVDTPKIIYRPRFEELNEDHFERFYKWIYLRQNCRVIVDELMQVCPGPFRIPLYLKGIYTRGRARRTTVTGCTQRPTGIPQLCLSEAAVLYVLDLNLPTDRSKLAEVTGIPALMKRPGKRLAWHYLTGQDEAQKVKFVA